MVSIINAERCELNLRGSRISIRNERNRKLANRDIILHDNARPHVFERCGNILLIVLICPREN